MTEICNYREVDYSFGDKKITIAGMAHPLYNRSPTDAINELSSRGVKTIFSLEVRETGLISEVFAKAGEGNKHYLVDVEDFTAPSEEQLAGFLDYILSLEDGDKVAIHCHGGNGRTGTMMAAAAILETIYNIEKSGVVPEYNPDKKNNVHVGWGDVHVTDMVLNAITKVRGVENGENSVECEEQVEALISLEENMMKPLLRAKVDAKERKRRP